ncbi:hypothetical protein TNCT_426221 [Trichonephila clavata]|uniref:Uncharacterized protein n=1 Tax=Trichonephila clavata TaxID=2740835 RepID=A0A8X6LIM2_TRICU|nr:hypothetical protein TNCT_426221 [Trichonephila clavata]
MEKEERCRNYDATQNLDRGKQLIGNLPVSHPKNGFSRTLVIRHPLPPSLVDQFLLLGMASLRCIDVTRFSALYSGLPTKKDSSAPCVRG